MLLIINTLFIPLRDSLHAMVVQQSSVSQQSRKRLALSPQDHERIAAEVSVF